MKKPTSIILLLFFISCASTKNIDYSNSFWGELESEETYLYTSNSTTSVVEKEIKKGTILFFHTLHGEFHEVYTRNPKSIKNSNDRQTFRYYLHKPKFKKLSYQYKKDNASIYEIPFNANRNYISGERGGCYYINKQGNKTYVNRSYCGFSKPKTNVSNYKVKKNYKSKTNCGTVQCSGRTKKGTRCRNKTTNCSGRCHLH